MLRSSLVELGCLQRVQWLLTIARFPPNATAHFLFLHHQLLYPKQSHTAISLITRPSPLASRSSSRLLVTQMFDNFSPSRCLPLTLTRIPRPSNSVHSAFIYIQGMELSQRISGSRRPTHGSRSPTISWLASSLSTQRERVQDLSG